MKTRFLAARNKIGSRRAAPSAPVQHVGLHELTTLNQVLTQLTGTLSPEKVLNTVTESCERLSPGVTGTAIYLFWDDHKSTLALVRSAGMSERFVVNPPDPYLFAALHKHDLATVAPLTIENAAAWQTEANAETHAARLRAVLALENKQACIELPLTVGGVGLGVLVLYYDHARTFAPEHIELLRTFATQVAQSVTNARLYAITDEALERRVGQLLALAAIGHELTATIDLDQICTLVLNHALNATHAHVGSIVVLDSTLAVEKLVTRGYAESAFANPARALSGITRRVVESGKPTVTHDPLSDPDYVPLHPGTRALLCLPIMRTGSVVGAITLESDDTSVFHEEDVHFATQLSNQAVIAIDNARLFRRVAEALHRLHVILNAMKEGLILIDHHGVVALANHAIRVLGLSPDALMNEAIEDLLESPTLDIAHRFGFASENEVRRIVKELRASDAITERPPAAYTLEVNGSAAHIERRVIPVTGSDGQPLGVLLVFYDETEPYKLDQAREDLSRMLVHDLRSPLTAVTTSLRLLTELVPKDADFRPAVESTTDAARRAIRKLLSRVDSLLDVSRLESGLMLERKPTELATLVDNVIIELSPLARELNVSIHTDGIDALPLLDIDADKVERLILNLLDNALKFSPLDSHVRICAHGIGTGGAASGFVRVDVTDQGPGIPADYKTRLFDRFVQVQGRTGSRRGSGLGLTFCRLVAEAHGGKIWIEDQPGGGSVFAFTLPLISAPSA